MRTIVTRATTTITVGTLLLFGAGVPAEATIRAPGSTACQSGGHLIVDGPSRSVLAVEAGVAVCQTFTGDVGGNISIGLYTPMPDGSWVGYANRVTVRDPHGAVVAIFSAESPQVRPIFSLPVPTLTTAGTYTVELKPIWSTYQLRVVASVSSRQHDGTVTIDGPGRPLTYDRVGQRKDVDFSGRAHELVSVTITDFQLSTPQANAAPGLWIEVYRPTSPNVAYRGVAFRGGRFDVGPLREHGRFTIRTWPLDASAGSATIGVATLDP